MNRDGWFGIRTASKERVKRDNSISILVCFCIIYRVVSLRDESDREEQKRAFAGCKAMQILLGD